MRLRHPGGQTLHLGYCTNVHPAQDLPGVVSQLRRYAAEVRRRLDTPLLSVGLWLAAPVAAHLAGDAGALRRLRAALDAHGLEVVTLNGFPYRSFQDPVVKHAVYHPDWTRPERLDYTLDLARVLAGLLPADADRGSVSTLPLAWRTPWDPRRADTCRRALDRLAAGLADLESRTGRRVRAAFEPEPGCVVENTDQAVAALAGTDTERLGVCLDLAHLACAWEQPEQALATLAAAGVPVVKVQVSAALEIDDPRGAREMLREWAEPRFLHQVSGPRAAEVRRGGLHRISGARPSDVPDDVPHPATGPATPDIRGHARHPTASPGTPGVRADDLGEALDRDLPGPWRIHYHVPLHAEPVAPLGTTVQVLRAGLDALLSGPQPACDHFEVETYTWGVLPEARRPATDGDLADGIAAELSFARDEFMMRMWGLEPAPRNPMDPKEVTA